MKKLSLSKDINDDLLDSNLHNMNTPKDFSFKPINNYQNESLLPNIPKFTSDKNQSI